MGFMHLALAAALAFGVVAGPQTESDSKLMVLTGVVKSVSSSSLTLGARGADITFAVNRSTRIVGTGPPRDLLWRGPRPISDFVKTGDRVTVTYRQSADAVSAVQVRIAQRSGE